MLSKVKVVIEEIEPGLPTPSTNVSYTRSAHPGERAMNYPDDLTEPCPHCAQPVSVYAGCLCPHCKKDMSEPAQRPKTRRDNLKTVTTFSNIGVGEAYLKQEGFNVTLACELELDRCQVYKQIYPSVKMLCADISQEDTKAEYCRLATGAHLLIATPPCQGLSSLNGQDKDDPRNNLLYHVIDLIERIRPNYVLVENVPQILSSVQYEHMRAALAQFYAFNGQVLNAKNYNTPQNRNRAIVLLSKFGLNKWQFPEPCQNVITLRDAIGELPSLESGEQKGHRLHRAGKHSPKRVEWLKHTEEGQSAFFNEAKYPGKLWYPHVIDNDGTRRIIRRTNAFANTYQRMKWDEPAPTLIQAAHNMGSSNTVHPGRRLLDGTQSDARTLTILEAMRVMGLPDDWPLPTLPYKKSMQMLGEGICPKLVQALVENMP